MRSKVLNVFQVLALTAVAGLGLAHLLPTRGMAAPLAKDACDALKSEQGALASAGIRADLARGAAWGKVNLAADRITKIARLIEVDEQILFRCASPPPPDVEAAAEAKPKPVAKPQAQKKAQDQRAEEKPAEAAASESGGKLSPQSAKAVSDAPTKPTKAGIAAEKRRGAATAKSPIEAKAAPETKVQTPAKSQVQTQVQPQAQTKIKSGDAFVPPPDAAKSTLQPPVAAGATKAQ